VIDTGGPNARLRAEPSIEATIVESVQDGTRVTDLGAEVAAGGRTWRRVTGPGGSTAWIDASLLLPIGSASTGR
jgi:Bacterial SH3 domain